MNSRDWANVGLADIVQITTGKLDSNAAVMNGRYPFFTCSPETFRINDYAFDTEAILLAGNNANGVFPIKHYSGRFNAYQRTYVITARDPATLSLKYLYYQLSTQLSRLQEFSIGSATKFLTKRILDPLEIPLPPLSQQGAIAGVLGALDDKIELNRRMNATLERMMRTIFEEWFVDGEEVDGWKLGRIGDIADNVRRTVQPAGVDSQTPYIGLEHMPRESIALQDWGAAGDVTSNKFAFRRNEFLFGKLRPYFRKVGVAPIDGVSSTDILVIAPKAAEYYGVVLGHISSPALIDFATQASTGTKMPRTNWQDVASYQIAVPPLSRAREFTSLVKPMIELMQGNIMEIRTLASLRDTLLPKLMSGEVRVKL